MAPKTAPTPTPAEPTKLNLFGYPVRSLALPPAARGPVGSAKEPNALMGALAGLSIDQMILEPIDVPASITDEGERDKEFKAMARKLQNRIGGAIKRHRGQEGNALHNFAQRVLNQPSDNEDENYVGVGIWRVADKTEAELAEEKAAADAAKAAKVPPAPPAPPVA